MGFYYGKDRFGTLSALNICLSRKVNNFGIDNIIEPLFNTIESSDQSINRNRFRCWRLFETVSNVYERNLIIYMYYLFIYLFNFTSLNHVPSPVFIANRMLTIFSTCEL